MASVTPVHRTRGYAWRVQARDETGRMRQETFSGDDARAVERAAIAFGGLVDRVGIAEAIRIRDARSGEHGPAGITLAAWIDRYLDPESGILTGVTDGTREAYRRMAAATITPRLGEMPVAAIGQDDVAQWVRWMEDQPSPRDRDRRLSTKTVRNHHGFLSQVLAAADARGMRTGNPARGARIRRQRRQGMVVLTQDEFQTLLAFVAEEWRPLIMWLAGTGMRWGEATALTWGDIDRASRPMLVTIDKAWQKSPVGSGDRILGPPKTEAGERVIGVPDELVNAIGTPRGGGDLVFHTSADTPLWSGSFYPRVWQPAVAAANDADACRAAGVIPLGKRPRLHDLRHCHASWLIAAGRPLPYIQRRLGHEKITTTVGTYGHLLPDAQQGDADAVSAAMAGVLPIVEPDEPAMIEG